MYRDPLTRLQDYIEAADFNGYDPYDALNSPILRALSFRRKFLRIVFIQLIKHLPEVTNQKPDNCEFLGQLDAEELAQFYRDARMVVFATRCYEGFPTVLLEAMSYGLPIICSRIGGLPEIVEEEKTGLLYEPGNVDELADRIRMLWRDPAFCQRLGDAGRRKVREDYAADRLLNRLLGIYEKVIMESSDKIIRIQTHEPLNP